MSTVNRDSRLSMADEIKEVEEWRFAVERTNELLTDVLGASAPTVESNWDVSYDARKRPVIRLTLKDFTGSVSTTFAPGDLARGGSHLERRLYSLWGDLLEKRSQWQLQELKEAVDRLGGE
jgi:hypothetical protein